MLTDWMLISDSGNKGPIATVVDKVFDDGSYIKHFNIRMCSKETYELYKTPQKFNSYLLNLSNAGTIPLGVTVIVASEEDQFNWLFLSHNYDTIGVRGIAVPVGAINANIFSNY
jgi:hypothetical protein